MINKGKLSVEIGGTFTDIILVNKNENQTFDIEVLKVPSTPAMPEQGVINGVDKLNSKWSRVPEVLHGSTVATNAVLERKGAKTAFLVTNGFRDILEIQRGDKRNIYDLFYERTPSLVSLEKVIPIKERILQDGSVLENLDEEQVREAALFMKKEKIEAIGICFLHSYINPNHELEAKKIIESYVPDATIITSAEISPQFREYERASTTVMSAYIAPTMVRYINSLQSQFNDRGFNGKILITQSNGGVIPVNAIQKEVVRTLLSGPAAGVTGAAYVASQVGIKNIITLDMGGTSADVCLVNNGEPLITSENKVNGLPIAVPMIDINTVGAGGGSIAWVDKGGMLRVGPKSAGADPGPACYARGGKQPTVTDANVYKGVIRPSNFAGGTYEIDPNLSKQVITELSQKIDDSLENTTEAITKIVESNMIQAIRVVSTQRGYDARDHTLVAFGGAGPLHAAKLAEEIGMEEVLVPRFAGILSSFGLLAANIIRDYVQTDVSLCRETDLETINRRIDQLKQKSLQEFKSYGFLEENIQYLFSCDARYQGQAFELSVPLEEPFPNPAEIEERFHSIHLKRYGYNSDQEAVEIVNYRIQAMVPRNENTDQMLKYVPTSSGVVMEESTVMINGSWQPSKFFEWNTLPVDYEIFGPSVVEESTTTCFIPEGWKARVLENGSLLLKWGKRQ